MENTEHVLSIELERRKERRTEHSFCMCQSERVDRVVQEGQESEKMTETKFVEGKRNNQGVFWEMEQCFSIGPLKMKEMGYQRKAKDYKLV